MIENSIIVAVITGLFSVVGVYFANSKQQAVIIEKISQLEKKVEKHNNLVERMTAAETKIEHIEKELQ